MQKPGLLIALLSILVVSCTTEEVPWRDLIGDNLTEWEQLNGSADYKIVDWRPILYFRSFPFLIFL